MSALIKLPGQQVDSHGLSFSLEREAFDMPAVRAIVELLNGKLDSRWEPPLYSEKFLAMLSLYQYRIVLTWALREQTKMLSPGDEPFRFSSYQAMEPDGIRLNAKLELCYRCFDELSRMGISGIEGYSNAAELFKSATQEEFCAGLGAYAKSLDQIAGGRRRTLKMLKDGNNPYPDSQRWQHNHALFKLATTMSARLPSDSNRVKQSRTSVRRALDHYCRLESKAITHCEFSQTFCVAYPTDSDAIAAVQKRVKNQPAKKVFSGSKNTRSLKAIQ